MLFEAYFLADGGEIVPVDTLVRRGPPQIRLDAVHAFAVDDQHTQGEVEYMVIITYRSHCGLQVGHSRASA